MPGNYCLIFGHFVINSSLLIVNGKQLKNGNTRLAPRSPVYYNEIEYCNNWTKFVTPLKGVVRKLLPGIFLVCEDRAWSAILQEAVGGPCYFGKLTLLLAFINALR